MKQPRKASIANRVVFSVVANIVRAALSLVSGLMVARALGPADYGNMSYLLGSFLALRALLDMGASSGFYTFISGRRQSLPYYLVYFFWLSLQFIVSITLVMAILPTSLGENIWRGQDHETILLSLMASFMQNQVWLTVVQLFEARRWTIAIQSASVLVVVAHILFVGSMKLLGILTISSVLWAILVEYVSVAVWAAFLQKSNSIILREVGLWWGEATVDAVSIREALSDYLVYCQPMTIIAVFSFAYELADRWLLQNFGGAAQQGFFQVASQLSIISLLATTSLLNILWKEVAEATSHGDAHYAYELYERSKRQLMLLAALVSCFLTPWSREITLLLLGKSYESAWPVLLVMLLYPIHQTLGQINGAMFMASGETRSYMLITVFGMIVSMPASYLALANSDAPIAAGFDLGALGLAMKTVLFNVVLVNIQSWLIARHYSEPYRWLGQVMSVVILLCLGFAIAAIGHEVLAWLSGVGVGWVTAFIAALTVSGMLYLCLIALLLLYAPHWLDISSEELLLVSRAVLGKLSVSQAQ